MCQPFFEPKIVWPLVMMAESSVKLQAMLGTLRRIDELAPRPGEGGLEDEQQGILAIQVASRALIVNLANVKLWAVNINVDVP